MNSSILSVKFRESATSDHWPTQTRPGPESNPRTSSEMVRDIDVLNEVEAAGGVQSAPHAKSLRKRPAGEVVITDGPYLETREHIGGFWILDAANMDEALAWGRKAVVACRASVEVREFLAMPTE